MKAVGQIARGDYFRRELDERLEEKARVGRDLSQRRENRRLKPGRIPTRRLSRPLPKPLPSGGRAHIHHLPHTRGAELKQDLGAGRIGLTYQGHGGDFRKVARQVVQLVERRPTALPDREEDRVYRTLPDHPDDVGERLSMEERKTTSAWRI